MQKKFYKKKKIIKRAALQLCLMMVFKKMKFSLSKLIINKKNLKLNHLLTNFLDFFQKKNKLLNNKN